MNLTQWAERVAPRVYGEELERVGAGGGAL